MKKPQLPRDFLSCGLPETANNFWWQPQLSIPRFYSPVDSRSPGEYLQKAASGFIYCR
jgi:hypothetical protein